MDLKTHPKTDPKPDPRAQRRVETEVLEDGRAFAALREEWARLHENAPAATPFQSWEWLYTWWEHYGGGHALRLVTVRDGRGVLVGAAPLMLDRRPGRLLFVGTGITDYLDVLVRDGWGEEVAPAVAGAMREMGGWAVADLQELGPGAEAWRLVGAWGGPKARPWQSSCMVLDANKPWEEVLGALSGKFRGNVRRALRRAEADGVRCETVGAADAEEAARRLVALHREGRREGAIDPEHLTDRFESHVTSAVRRMAERGLGCVREYRRDGEVLFAAMLVFGKDSAGGYLDGQRDGVRRRYQVNCIQTRYDLETSHQRGLSRFDFLRGEEPYKLRWDPEVADNHRAILGKNRAAFAPYAAYHALRAAARRAEKEGRPPLWARALRRAKETRDALKEATKR